jgi:predicted O-methyltransferase YrrM
MSQAQTEDEKMVDIIKLLQQPPEKHETEAIFNLMKKLKEVNPGDTWLDNYNWHLQKQGDKFYDTYHVMLRIGSKVDPKNILEIGCRSGISICQLLHACSNNYIGDKRICLFDVFNDGFISPELVRMNLEHLNIDANIVEFYTGKSEEEIPKFKAENPQLKFDYILVDGSHDKRDAIVDLNNVANMLNPNGVIVFDDIAPDGCNLVDVWNEWKEQNGTTFKYFENFDGKGVGVAVQQ